VGILVGACSVAAITLTHSTIGGLLPFLPDALKDLNVGLVALLLNVVVTALVSIATRPNVVEQSSPA